MAPESVSSESQKPDYDAPWAPECPTFMSVVIQHPNDNQLEGEWGDLTYNFRSCSITLGKSQPQEYKQLVMSHPQGRTERIKCSNLFTSPLKLREWYLPQQACSQLNSIKALRSADQPI